VLGQNEVPMNVLVEFIALYKFRLLVLFIVLCLST